MGPFGDPALAALATACAWGLPSWPHFFFFQVPELSLLYPIIPSLPLLVIKCNNLSVIYFILFYYFFFLSRLRATHSQLLEQRLCCASVSS